MIHARACLHLAAALIPAGLAASVSVAVLNVALSAQSLSEIAQFAGPAVLAAQLAAWLCWGALERRARSGRNGWPVGLGMAALTHALFGLLLMLVMLVVGFYRGWIAGVYGWSMASLGEAALLGSIVALFSLGITGVPSFLLTIWLAQRLTVRRRKELNLESV